MPLLLVGFGVPSGRRISSAVPFRPCTEHYCRQERKDSCRHCEHEHYFRHITTKPRLKLNILIAWQSFIQRYYHKMSWECQGKFLLASRCFQPRGRSVRVKSTDFILGSTFNHT